VAVSKKLMLISSISEQQVILQNNNKKLPRSTIVLRGNHILQRRNYQARW
jgi:hypothetical protein